MKVLMSIKPQFAKKIFDGSKGYEYRRVIFSRSDVKIVIVYVSSPIKQIVGEFDIEKIICDNSKNIWIQTKDRSGITFEQFSKYFADKEMGYAIKIGSIRKYSVPKLLSSISITKAPQSFRYISD